MSLHPKVIDLTLDRVYRLLNRLGNPEENLPPVIHVAGTNGKGSVIAYMRAALESAGYSVHVYTSPHLVRFHERIRLAGELIDEAALSELLKECEKVNGSEQITFFEVTTCAAMLAFSRVPADVVILETGLGGRLDATNIIKQPTLTVITEISIDHQQFLGATLLEIAGEKAGIIKNNVPLVVGPQKDEVQNLLLHHAADLSAPMIMAGRDWITKVLDNGIIINAEGQDQYLPRPALPGDHQIQNAALAVKALGCLPGLNLSGRDLAWGVSCAEWPARFQHLVRGPLVDALPQAWELWLDGGHNEAAAQAIASEVSRWNRGGDRRPLHLIFGMLNTKDAGAFLSTLQPVTTSMHTVQIPGEENALSAEDLATAAKAVGHSASPSVSVAEALADIIANAVAPARVLICGSLYLAGEILAENG